MCVRVRTYIHVRTQEDSIWVTVMTVVVVVAVVVAAVCACDGGGA